jgi:hypothetical protein
MEPFLNHYIDPRFVFSPSEVVTESADSSSSGVRTIIVDWFRIRRDAQLRVVMEML